MKASRTALSAQTYGYTGHFLVAALVGVLSQVAIRALFSNPQWAAQAAKEVHQ